MLPGLIFYGAIPALPLLALQGLWTRKQVPQLPSVTGPERGLIAGNPPRLRLAVLGESPVAGVGVRTHHEGLTGQIATALSKATGCAVDWLAIGENGISLEDCRLRLAPRVLPFKPDYLVIVAGVNDTTRLTSRRRWRQAYSGLLDDLCPVTSRAILCTGVPPMASFPALPPGLRQVLGARAAILDSDLRQLMMPRSERMGHLPMQETLRRTDLASDGYHPSATGCRRWGVRIAHGLLGIQPPWAHSDPVAPWSTLTHEWYDGVDSTSAG